MLVVTGGPGQAAGSASANSAPCRTAAAAGGAGRRGEVQHPVRSQPPGHPDGEIGQLPGQPGHVIAGIEHDQHVRVAVAPVPGVDEPGDDRRTWVAVTSVSSSSGPSRTASKTEVHEVRPGSKAATKEYGQPGIIWACPLPRPYTWQNSRSGLVIAPGRSQLLTSAASRIRPSGQAGNGKAASSHPSRGTSIRPAPTAS